MEQLQEFNESLSKMISGDMTLVDQLGSMQLVSELLMNYTIEPAKESTVWWLHKHFHKT